ncbi:hypothetical protein UCMB321_5218 [Pseudomonas batumici]|uniref:Uncharacterized protein n=1 Tax=Pseudomonas batumici TaxID=226910 RepID=A0A0C2I1U9_9PSED|nr:hypothetical protein UCMB321_5218 [Pseudomonas batumici]
MSVCGSHMLAYAPRRSVLSGRSAVPAITPRGQLKLSISLPFFSGTQVYADEQDFSR